MHKNALFLLNRPALGASFHTKEDWFYLTVGLDIATETDFQHSRNLQLQQLW